MHINLKYITILVLILSNGLANAQTPCTVIGQNDTTAFPICGSTTFVQSTVPLCGNYPLTVPPCKGDGYTYTDINPSYYQFTCFKTGTLGFYITPVNLSDDYDWQLFDISNHQASNIYTNDSLFVACNWSGMTGKTGADSSGTSTYNCGGYLSSNISAMPYIIAGHNYLLLVSHFNPSQSGYDLSFSGGTAIIADTVSTLVYKATGNCFGNEVSIKLNKQMLCSSLSADASDFTISSNHTISSIEGVGCKYGFTTDSIIITLANPLPDGNYQVVLQTGTDGNTLMDICGDIVPEATIPLSVASVPTIIGDSAIYVGEKDTLQLTALGNKWLSNNSAVATVDSNGIVTAHLAGVATIVDTATFSCGIGIKTFNITVSNPLPVSIDKYQLTIENNKKVLNSWHTTTELNTSHFIVQQSTDGSSFTDIGTVKAIGSGANSYSFTDMAPLSAGEGLGVRYYRLQSVDKDGSSTFSKVVSASLTINNSPLTIYPNPAKDNVTISGNHISSVQVIDNFGKVVKVVSLHDATNPTIQVSTLVAGVYHLRVQTTDGKVNAVSFVKE